MQGHATFSKLAVPFHNLSLGGAISSPAAQGVKALLLEYTRPEEWKLQDCFQAWVSVWKSAGAGGVT